MVERCPAIECASVLGCIDIAVVVVVVLVLVVVVS